METTGTNGRLRDRIIRFIGGITGTDLDTATHKGYIDGFNEALGMGGNDEPPLYTPDGKAISLGYRQLQDTPRDLSAVSQERAIDAAYRLWNTNPLAKALTEIKVDYTLGDGAVIDARVEEVGIALDLFWKDPVNRLDEEGSETITRELGMFGEQMLILFTRDGSDQAFVADGRLRYGTVDPAQIGAIITNPDNQRDLIAVRLKDENGAIDTGPIYKVVRQEDTGGAFEGVKDQEAYRNLVTRINKEAGRMDWTQGDCRRMVESALPRDNITRRLKEGQEWAFKEMGNGRAKEAKGKLLEDIEYDGECFFFQVNKISTGIRGRPDMLPLIDWLDRYDQLFFDGAEHAGLLNSFVWDLEVQDGSEGSPDPETNLIHQANKIRKARQNSVYAHNQKTMLEPKNPDLKTADLETLIRSLRVFISGGERIPEHWIAEGGYTNRATAKEMGQPTFRMLTRRQEYVKGIFTKLCQYQVDILVALGQLQEEYTINDEAGKLVETVKARDAFDVVMPDINVSDTQGVTASLMNVSNSIFRLFSIDLLTPENAIELIAVVAQMMGVEVDVEKTKAYYEEAEADKRDMIGLMQQFDQDTNQANDDEQARQDADDEVERAEEAAKVAARAAAAA